ncbi:MAG: hypothetical protein U0269_21705 [Polyangiales bacterium]
MNPFDNSPRARWLLTLSAFGVACGQPMPTTDATAMNDASAMPDSVVISDASAMPDGSSLPDASAMADSSAMPDGSSTPDASTGSDAGAEASVGAYPAGPYGSNEGETLEDLQMDGYLNTAGMPLSTMLPFGAVSMQSLRQTGRRYALVHTSATY